MDNVKQMRLSGGALVFEVGYHPRKKIHIIRVVFQDQAMYMHASFKGAKTCKLGKSMFLVILTNFGKGHDTQMKKNACKNTYLGSIFIPENTCLRYESPFTRMISSLKYKCPQAIKPTIEICFVILLFCTYEYILSYITCFVNNVKINVTICSIPNWLYVDCFILHI